MTIGGTVIEVAYEDSRIFFDFGSEYNPASPHQPENLQELLDTRMVPALVNLFDPDIPLTGYQLQGPNPFSQTAVFLSHVHLDHTKIINYLDPDIPLYALKGTRSLLKSLNINNDFVFPLHRQKGPDNIRDIIGVEDNETIQVGAIQVKLMPIDHDAYGASGFIITTPDLKIAYTGDLRLHGYREADTLAYCAEAKFADVLLMEGVTISFEEVDAPPEPGKEFKSEPQILKEINEALLADPNRQVTFNYYVANIERIVKIIETCPRQVVLDAYSAYVVKDATGMDVKYYSLAPQAYESALNPALKLPFQELLADRGTYFWQLSGPALDHLEQLSPEGLYIHSNAQPLGEFDPAYLPFMARFEQQGIQVMLASSTGHAQPKDLIKIIDLIQPKLLVPIHTLKPERLINKWGDRLLPERGQTI